MLINSKYDGYVFAAGSDGKLTDEDDEFVPNAYPGQSGPILDKGPMLDKGAPGSSAYDTVKEKAKSAYETGKEVVGAGKEVISAGKEAIGLANEIAAISNKVNQTNQGQAAQIYSTPQANAGAANPALLASRLTEFRGVVQAFTNGPSPELVVAGNKAFLACADAYSSDSGSPPYGYMTTVNQINVAFENAVKEYDTAYDSAKAIDAVNDPTNPKAAAGLYTKTVSEQVKARMSLGTKVIQDKPGIVGSSGGLLGAVALGLGAWWLSR